VDDWLWLRSVAAIVAWATVAGGLAMAARWVAKGGLRAIGPDDELMAESGVAVGTRGPVTSLSPAQIAGHGFFGIATAGLVTYAVVRDSDRTTGYVAVAVVLAFTGSLGWLMFRKWRSGRRPLPEETTGADRVEDHLWSPLVYAHGLAALATAVLVVALLILD
jgi:hypothetical protein